MLKRSVLSNMSVNLLWVCCKQDVNNQQKKGQWFNRNLCLTVCFWSSNKQNHARWLKITWEAVRCNVAKTLVVRWLYITPWVLNSLVFGPGFWCSALASFVVRFRCYTFCCGSVAWWMPSLVCPLDRFTAAVNQAPPFIHRLWIQFTPSIVIFTFLQPIDHCFLALTCIVVYVDRAEVALGATELRLGWDLSSWSVPTPPVQDYGSAISDTIASDSEWRTLFFCQRWFWGSFRVGWCRGFSYCWQFCNSQCSWRWFQWSCSCVSRFGLGRFFNWCSWFTLS